MVIPRSLACSRPASRTERVTPSLVCTVYRDRAWATPTAARPWAIADRHTPTTASRRQTFGAAATRGEQARLSPLPVVAERERKLGEIGRGSIRGIEVRLIAVAELLDGLAIPSVEPDPPRRLAQEAIRDP